jgi:hypothetical protein
MKASQAKPIIDGIVRGERWQLLDDNNKWVDISPEADLLWYRPESFRKNPEPRHFFVRVHSDGYVSVAYAANEVNRAAHVNDSTLVETVEVVK